MRKVLFLAVFIALILSLFYYLEFENYYESGENDTFDIKTGQEFHIKLYENGSTGYSNCWLNEKNNPLLKKIKKEYSPGLNSRLGYIGSGGIIKFTFKALKAGTDTIKFADCSFRDGQKCTNYTTKNTKSDNEFIIRITD